MKKFTLLVVLFFLFFTSKSQEVINVETNIEKIEVVDAGTATLNNGKIAIKCNQCDINGNCFIFLTELNQPMELFVSEKSVNLFIVESKKSMDGKFDYIIFKKTIIQISNKK